jgi:hypothetical protein
MEVEAELDISMNYNTRKLEMVLAFSPPVPASLALSHHPSLRHWPFLTTRPCVPRAAFAAGPIPPRVFPRARMSHALPWRSHPFPCMQLLRHLDGPLPMSFNYK